MNRETIKNHPLQEFQLKMSDKWKSPDDLGNDCGSPQNYPGVYLITYSYYDPFAQTAYDKVLYVGCSKDLKKRHANHEKLYELKKMHKRMDGKIYFWYLHCREYISTERKLIRDCLPPYNINLKKA